MINGLFQFSGTSVYAVPNIVIGIGLLKLKKWAHISAIGIRISSIIGAITGLFKSHQGYKYIFTQTQDASMQQKAIEVFQGQIDHNPLFVMLQFIISILIIIFLTRPKVMESFDT